MGFCHPRKSLLQENGKDKKNRFYIRREIAETEEISLRNIVISDRRIKLK
ncbi:hypothetical protein BCL69_100353 [Nitrosomonas communis]|uniref:Uncharacterized protein n=1 Tax=Nitrosomonas communis TaxID=44574 RepID=A0A5D3YHK1_9PROT|nr:hypothetical protein BCL69_100353 [Nitrosomonas communis]